MNIKVAILCCVVSLATVATGKSTADVFTYTGSELAAACDENSGAREQGFCSGYVSGVAAILHQMKAFFCLPADASSGQLVGIVSEYMIDNPTQQDLPAHAIVVRALLEAFPCPQ